MNAVTAPNRFITSQGRTLAYRSIGTGHPIVLCNRFRGTPILHTAGDRDVMFPVENWYALDQQLPTLRLFTCPRAGRGPHQQHPEASAAYIAAFLTSR